MTSDKKPLLCESCFATLNCEYPKCYMCGHVHVIEKSYADSLEQKAKELEAERIGHLLLIDDQSKAIEKLTERIEKLREALNYYAKHDSIIKEAYHVNERQIKVVHKFINHGAMEALTEDDRLAEGKDE